MAGISVTSGQGSGAQAAVKTGHPPRAKISVTSGAVSGSQAGANIGQTPRTKVPAPINPGRIGAAPSKVVTGLKRTATFSVSGMSGPYVYGVVCLSVYRGMCVTSQDSLFVGDWSQIRELDMTGRRTRVVSGLDGFCTGITQTADGVFISSWDSHIYKLSPGGVTDFCPLSFYPRSLTALSTGSLLVCGEGGLYTVTGRGEESVKLDINLVEAVDVAVSRNGEIAVADFRQRRVFILDCKYKHVASYSGDTTTFSPTGVSCDGDNFVVCDPNNNKIHVLDSRGVCQTVYKTKGDCRRGKPYRVDISPAKCPWVLFDNWTCCIYNLV